MNTLNKAEINYFEEDIVLPSFFNPISITNWLIEIALAHQKRIHIINYIFCSDSYLLQINKDYLDHDYFTDIITFPYREDDVIESDIFVSIDRIKDNAKELNTTYEEEFLRVVAHGLLHLCGYSDKEKEKALLMRQAEDKALSSFVKHK